MIKRTFVLGILLVVLAAARAQSQSPSFHHGLSVTLDPHSHSIQVVDTLSWTESLPGGQLEFLLHDALDLKLIHPATMLKSWPVAEGADVGMDQEDVSVPLKRYQIQLDPSVQQVVLQYQGKIHHPIVELAQEYARGFSTSPGLIDTLGVYLAGATYWVPTVENVLIGFDLSVNLPQSWDVVSQGQRTRHEIQNGHRVTRWHSPHPMEEVFLIAAPFHEYAYQAGPVTAMAFLRTPDENLANTYLETTAQYLEMYRQLIGPFPFSKFALVENFWETGYGMPSFTLLGEKVIRFPFILHSSYPHELLHNWWGNSVFVDFDGGNWCEGITAYMADHLIKEQRGQGEEYRRSTLQRFTDYVNPGNDFPVSKFVSRTDAATEAVGYGKALMAYEMLRQELGDEKFIRVFQLLNRRFAFKKASFDDIRRIADEVGERDFKPFFDQWIGRTGAPTLRLGKSRVIPKDGGFDIRFVLEQIQDEAPFDLTVPVAVTFEDDIALYRLPVSGRQAELTLHTDKPPVRLDVDPQFRVMRRLDPLEIPPALSKVLGEEKVVIVLPQKETPALHVAYENLARHWAQDRSKQIQIVQDIDVKRLPADAAVWVLGRESRFAPAMRKGLEGRDMAFEGDRIRLGRTDLALAENSVLLTVRHPENPRSAAAWLMVHDPSAVDGLIRKLPHYGKYSYLAFSGTAPDNTAKGQWTALHSSLGAVLDSTKRPSDKALPLRPALAQLAPVFSADRMMGHIQTLCAQEMEGRGLGTAGLNKAADYIAGHFAKMGLQPGGEQGYFQIWDETVAADGRRAPVRNIVAVLPGTNPAYAGQSVVVCAHYDHLGRGWPDVRPGHEGRVHPGADDNASGVAVMLELAETLSKSLKPERSVIFLATTAEEAGLKGARHYVQYAKAYPVSQCIGALNLDTVGRLGGQKLWILGASSAREWRFMFMGASYVTGVESEIVTQPLDASDQAAFIEVGIPAVQFFTGPHEDYHKPSDTPDRIDANGLVKVAAFVREAIVYLAARETPLTFQGEIRSTLETTPKASTAARRVSTGIMPDFSFAGPGVKVGAVSPDSPAAKAAIQKGDVIQKVDEQAVENLQTYSAMLKNKRPGDIIVVQIGRGSEQIEVSITLSER